MTGVTMATAASDLGLNTHLQFIENDYDLAIVIKILSHGLFFMRTEYNVACLVVKQNIL
jgi:hypothetical protein